MIENNQFFAGVGLEQPFSVPQPSAEGQMLDGADSYLAVFSKDGTANFAFYHKPGMEKHLAVLIHYITGPGVRAEIERLITETLETGVEIIEAADEFTAQYRPDEYVQAAVIQPLGFGKG